MSRNPGAVLPVKDADRLVALELIFGNLPADDRRAAVNAMLAETTESAQSRVALLGAYDGDELLAAGMYQEHPGHSASVWLPRATASAPGQARDALFAAVCERLDSAKVRLAQALVGECTGEEEELFLRWGFVRLADLLYLVCQEPEFPESPPSSAMTFEPYCEANHNRMAELVAATYRQSLDCPALNGVREIDDILAGYRATGRFDPRWWLIVRCDGRDVGCLLLADHPGQGNLELVYMGIVPRERGSGWGAAVVRQAQWLARQAGRARIVLAVDAENSPAICLYAAAGFQAWDRRIAFVRVRA